MLYERLKKLVARVTALESGATAPAAADVTVAVGTDGLAAGSAQAALQALATRVKALEDA